MNEFIPEKEQAVKSGELEAIDLFCGCGGISAGLRSAGFKIVAGADIEPKYTATFQHNFPESRHFNVDLTKFAPSEMMKILGIEPYELDLLAGGPPCQGFSKNVPRKYRNANDPNNLLVRTFLNYCETLAPKFILMENVAEMKNGFSRQFSEEIAERLEKVGYSVTHGVLNAAEYGVPQRRRRAFFLASRGTQKLTIPEPTHSENRPQLDFTSMHPFVSVWDAIGDLPSLSHGEGSNPIEYACNAFSDFQRKIRNGTRKVNNHIARRLEPKQYARIVALQPGQGHKDLPKHLQVRGGYSGAYGRLTKDMVAPTITRWVFHPGSGRWGHPVDVRTLTMREAARIQGFNDDFQFVGSFVQQASQIGNAVPPLLIEQLAMSMRKQLDM